MVEMKFTADKTFVPALEASMKSGDPAGAGRAFLPRVHSVDDERITNNE